MKFRIFTALIVSGVFDMLRMCHQGNLLAEQPVNYGV